MQPNENAKQAVNIDPGRVIDKLQTQLSQATMRNAVLESAVDQLTEKCEELENLLNQISKEDPHMHMAEDKK